MKKPEKITDRTERFTKIKQKNEKITTKAGNDYYNIDNNKEGSKEKV